MAYERINWQNGEVGNTPLNANNLNRMDMTLEEHDQKIGDHDYEIENLKTGAQGITEEINKKMDRINPQGSGTFSIQAVNADNITAQTVEADEIKVAKVGSKGGTAPVVFDNDILVNGITTPIGSLASSANSKAESASGRAEEAYTLASRANREAASAINKANDNKVKIDLHTGLLGEGVGDKEPIFSYLDGYYIAPNGRVTQYNATATLIKIEFLDFFFRGDNIIFNHVDLLPTENCIPCAWYDISGNFISAADGLNIIAEIDEQTFKITKQYIDYCIIPVPAGASSCKLSGLASGSADIRIQTSLSDAIKELQSKPEPATLVLTNPSPLPCTDGKKILGIHAKGKSWQNGTQNFTFTQGAIVPTIGSALNQDINANNSRCTSNIIQLPMGSVISAPSGYEIYLAHATTENGNIDIAQTWVTTYTTTVDGYWRVVCRNKNNTSANITPSECRVIANVSPTPTNPIEIIDASTEVVAKSEDGTQSNTITLPYTLKSVGNVADELVVNEDGSAKIVQRVGTTTIGALDWRTSSSGVGRFYADISDGIYSTKPICSTYRYSSTSYEEYTISHSKKSSTEEVLRIYVGDTRYNSASDFKNGMSDSVIYYELATPIETPLTAEEVASIRQLQTYKGTTVIDSEMQIESVTYAGDIKAYIDYRIEQIINPTALSGLSDIPDEEVTEE